MEDRIEQEYEAALRAYPIYGVWLSHVKGIGTALSAQMLAMLIVPEPGMNVGVWYKTGGLVPEWHEDQQAWRLPRPRKVRCAQCQGTAFELITDTEDRVCKGCETVLPEDAGKLTYYKYLRRCLHNVATSFVRVGGYYREVYNRTKARLQTQHAGDKAWPVHRIDDVARWITIKLFLSHLFSKWAELEGFTAPKPYALEILGHDQGSYIAPPEWDGKTKM